MSKSYVRLTALFTSITMFLLGAMATVLPNHLDDSKQVRQLFLLRELRVEIWSIGVIAALFAIGWRVIPTRVRTKVRAQLRAIRPAHWFGPEAVWWLRASAALTAIVIIAGVGVTARDLYKLSRLTALYVRDSAEKHYATFLINEARTAQASYDFPRAIKLFQHLEKEFANYAPFTSGEIRFIHAKIDTSRRLVEVADDRLQRFGYTPDIVQQWAEALLLNPRNEILRAQLRRALDWIESGTSSSRLPADACDRLRRTAAARKLAPEPVLKAMQRSLLYEVSGSDRSRLLQPDLINLTAQSLCAAPIYPETSAIWAADDIRALLEATDPEKLNHRPVQVAAFDASRR